MISLTANNKDTLKDFGLYMEVSSMEPPEPKTYTVDVPGGNGVINLTSALSGDTAYNNRTIKLLFTLADVKEDFERVKTQFSNFFNGREFDFNLSFDKEYTYHGWFTVSGYTKEGNLKQIELTIDADPYKYKKLQVIRVNAIGGCIVNAISGRMRVRPTIETEGLLKIIYNRQVFNVPQGAWKFNDILFVEGTNEIYLCSYDIRNLTWGDLVDNEITFADFSKKRIFEWYRENGDGTFVLQRWEDIESSTWQSLESVTWADLEYSDAQVDNIPDAFIAFEWGDL